MTVICALMNPRLSAGLILKAEPISAPNFGVEVHTDYILGIGKVNDSVKVLLNIDKVLGEDLKV